MMKSNRFQSYLLAALVLCGSIFLLSSCYDDMGSQETPNEPYVLSLGINSTGTTS